MDATQWTIRDFGNQWKIHGNIEPDYWTSDEMFRDHFPDKTPPFSTLEEQVVVDVGSGSGRILQMLSRYKPGTLIGVEPSHGFDILEKNTRHLNNLTLINSLGEDFTLAKKANYIFSLGVIHHIPLPIATVRNIYSNLVEGGTFVMWVYGFENNVVYVRLQELMRPAIRLIPDHILDGISLILSYMADVYTFLSKVLFRSRLPLTQYLLNLYSKCGRRQKKFIIFDQLNPVYAKYYKREEVISLLHDAGFRNINLFHRNGYSWTAIAKK